MSTKFYTQCHTLSIIILTYNAQKYLPTLLLSLYAQTLKDFELIVIDSSSQDDTCKTAEQYTNNVIVIPQSEFDHGGTRAEAAKMAQGELLIFLTQDALPTDEFSIKNVGAAYGKQLSYEDTNLFGKHLREFNYPDKTVVRSKEDIKTYGIKTAQLSNSFAAYRKDILLEIGNFKNDLILGEDVYAGAKMILAGYKLVYVAEAKVYHSHSYTVFQEFRRYFDIGVFHKSESWILENFGKAEGEGMKYIKSEVKYLITNGAWYLLPEFIVRNGMKYLGYKLGQKYEKLPTWMIKNMSMHHRWWDKSK